MYIFVDQRNDKTGLALMVLPKSHALRQVHKTLPLHIYKTQMKFPVSQILSICSWSASVNTFRMAVITTMCVA